MSKSALQDPDGETGSAVGEVRPADIDSNALVSKAVILLSRLRFRL